MQHHSNLFYYGTKIEVMLGDRVLYTEGLLFRRKTSGVVCYLPGVNPPHPEMELDSGSEWGIALDNGPVLSWMYLPDRYQPSKRIQFLYRGDPEYRGLMPSDPLN